MPPVDQELYQLEVKRVLVQHAFNPAAGWRVIVDVDAMELGKGGQQGRAKIRRTRAAFAALQTMGATIGSHELYGRADIVAHHHKLGRRIVEVEGVSRNQPEQAIYSALGQLLIVHRGSRSRLRYGLAVPDSLRWRKQLVKIPLGVRKLLALEFYIVSDQAVRILKPHQEVVV